MRSIDQRKLTMLPTDVKMSTSPILFSTRASVTLLCFFGCIIFQAIRVNMSVAIICMVNQTAQDKTEYTNDTNSFTDSKCPNAQSVNESAILFESSVNGELQWSKLIQGHILGSFYYGYIVTQLLGGWLSQRFGGRPVFGWSMFTCAVVTLLVPMGARLHYGALMMLRIIIGLCQGVMFPAIYCVLSRWSPPNERSRLTGFVNAGQPLGTVLTLPFSGMLCQYGFAGGWPSIFYILGILAIIWIISWIVIVSDSPEEHASVSQKEREYIEMSLQGHGLSRDAPASIPWWDMLTSLPLWGIVVMHTTFNWATYCFDTNLPTYIKEVLGLDMKSNGALASLPFIFTWFMTNLACFIADSLIEKKYLTTTVCRKLFNTSSTILMSVFVIGLANVGCNQVFLASVLLIISFSFMGVKFSSGCSVNVLEIAPNYVGVVYGIANTIGTIPGFLAPLLIGTITENGLPSEWRVVFYLSCGIQIMGAIFYLFTASGEVQPWAHQKLKPNNIVKVAENEEQINMLKV